MPRGNSRLIQVGRPAIATSKGGVGLGNALQILSVQLRHGVWAQARAVDVRPKELVAFASTLMPRQPSGTDERRAHGREPLLSRGRSAAVVGGMKMQPLADRARDHSDVGKPRPREGVTDVG